MIILYFPEGSMTVKMLVEWSSGFSWILIVFDLNKLNSN